MKATEFRIGNYIVGREGNIVIEGIITLLSDQNNIVMKAVNGFEFNNSKTIKVKPIPITEEWLIKFGFEKVCDLHYRFNSYEYCSGNLDNGYSLINEHEIKYVHQLQNLYFALTGTELPCDY